MKIDWTLGGCSAYCSRSFIFPIHLGVWHLQVVKEQGVSKEYTQLLGEVKCLHENAQMLEHMVDYAMSHLDLKRDDREA